MKRLLVFMLEHLCPLNVKTIKCKPYDMLEHLTNKRIYYNDYESILVY